MDTSIEGANQEVNRGADQQDRDPNHAQELFDLKRQREEQDHELKMFKAELKNDIDAAEIEQDRKEDLTTMAMRYVKKASDG